MAISTLVVLSGLTLGKLPCPDVCLLPMWLARVKLVFDGAHQRGNRLQFSYKILQAERDQKVDEVRIDGFSQRLTPLEIMSHSED